MAVNKTKFVLVLIILIIVVHSTFAALKTFTVQETDLVKINAEVIDADGDELTYRYSPPLDENGEWQTDYGDEGVYNLKITASDGINQTQEKVVLIVEHKKKPNHKPELNLTSLTVNEGEKVILDLPSKDLDGDKLTYSFEDKFDYFGVWATSFEDAGIYEIDVSASDGEFTTKATVEIVVNDVDRAPELNLPESFEVYEGEEFSFLIDTEDPDGDEITLNFENAPKEFLLKDKFFSCKVEYDFIQRKGGLISNVLNSLRLEHFFLQVKTVTMEVTSCGKDLCTSKYLLLKIHNVNRAPVLDLLNITITENEIAFLTPTATDPDGDIVRVTFSEPFNSKGSWETGYDDEGRHIVYVAATDGKITTTLPIEVNVAKDNRKPTLIVRNDEVVVNEGQEFSFTVTAEDPDDDELFISLEEIPPGATFHEGVFTWKPSYDTVQGGSSSWTDNLVSDLSYLNKKFNQEGKTVWLTFIASDGEFEILHPVRVVVKDVNKGPEILDYLPSETLTARIGEPVIFHIAAKDVDNDKLNYKWSFGLGSKKVTGTDTIERTFLTPGKKKVRVVVSDGAREVAKEWSVQVLEETFSEDPVYFSPDDFKVYIIET